MLNELRTKGIIISQKAVREWNRAFPGEKYDTPAFKALLKEAKSVYAALIMEEPPLIDFVQQQYSVYIQESNLAVLKRAIAAVDERADEYNACSDEQKQEIDLKMHLLRHYADELEAIQTKKMFLEQSGLYRQACDTLSAIFQMSNKSTSVEVRKFYKDFANTLE